MQFFVTFSPFPLVPKSVELELRPLMYRERSSIDDVLAFPAPDAAPAPPAAELLDAAALEELAAELAAALDDAFVSTV